MVQPCSNKVPRLLCVVAACLGFLQLGCQRNSAPPKAQAETPALVASSKSAQQRPGDSSKEIRNVIVLIGDGMGPQQLGLLFAYSHLAPNSVVPDRTPAVELLSENSVVGLVRTEPYGAIVVDSAASATQLATGEMAGSEMIGANYRGDSVPTVLEIAKQSGKATGLVSDTRITHATPAAFAAHQPHRTRENEIAVDMFENRVDVMFSGGLRNWVPEMVNEEKSPTHISTVLMLGGAFSPSSRRQDNRNLLLEAREDYQLVFDREQLQEVEEGRILGLFADSAMDDAISLRDQLDSDERTEPTLSEMTTKALEVLSQDPDGFFLMVESGQIDWCGHNNDAGSLLQELLRLDEAVRVVYEWAKDRDDTVVVLTADHETGSFGFSYSGSPIPEPAEREGEVFSQSKFEPQFNFADPAVLDQLYEQRRSYFKIFLEFDLLEEEEKTPEKLLQLVNEGIAPFSITLDDAKLLLERSPNKQYAEGHSYLGTETLPRIPDQESFYVYGENIRMNHLGHIIGSQQNVVWGTGTHTSTPVALIAHGPAEATARFSGLMHMTDVGKALISLVRGE